MGTRDGHPGASADLLTFGRGRGRMPRRWPWVLGAVLLTAAGAIVIVVRPLVAAADFRALQSRWTAAVAVDLGRGEVIARLTREAAPSDVDMVTAASVALQREEARRLVALRAGAAPGLARDGPVSALAAAERTALSREIGDLRGAPLTAWKAATDVAFLRVQTLLAAGQRRFGVPAPVSPRPARLTAADGTLRRLRRLLDDTVPAALLVADNGKVQIADLRSGSVAAAPGALQGLGLGAYFAQAGPVVPRAGFVAVQAGGQVYAMNPTLAGTRRLLGTGQMLPAARPDAVWILSGSGRGHLVMVTGTGRRITGPVPVLANPPGSRVYANLSGLALPGGLVVEKDRYAGTGDTIPVGLWLWNPLRGPALRPLARGCAKAIAAHGRLLAWLGCGPGDPARARLHITDTATGADRVIPSPATAVPVLADQPAAAFSPNGSWLATYYSGTTSAGYALGLVNTRTGMTSIVGGVPVADGTAAAGYPAPIMWTGDSTRVFFATGGSSFEKKQPWADDTVPLATYRIGARSAADLRLHEPDATLLTVLPVGG
jgi:hypothetical protein